MVPIKASPSNIRRVTVHDKSFLTTRRTQVAEGGLWGVVGPSRDFIEHGIIVDIKKKDRKALEVSPDLASQPIAIGLTIFGLS